MLAAWLFDFRSGGAGQGLDIQLFFLVAYSGFFGLFLYADRAARVTMPGFAPFAGCALLYLCVSVSSGLLGGQEAYLVFRHVLTILIYVSATYATARMVATSAELASLRRALAWLCFGFALSTFFIVLFFMGGVDIMTVRYQIQGASTVAALGLVLLSVIIRLSRVELAAGMSAALIVFLSITRSYLIVAAAQALVPFPQVRRLLRPRAVATLAVGTVAAALILQYDSDSATRWIQRLFVSSNLGVDPTYLTRLYEWQYMWEKFLSSVDTFLFGAGLAAETAYWIPVGLGESGFISSSIGFGHNQHLSLLFTAGLIGGAPLLIIQFWQGWLAFRFLPRAGRYINDYRDLVFLGAWGATIVLGSLAGNFLASTFGDRGFSLWYGIGTGLLIGSRTYLRGTFRGVHRRPEG